MRIQCGSNPAFRDASTPGGAKIRSENVYFRTPIVGTVKLLNEWGCCSQRLGVLNCRSTKRGTLEKDIARAGQLLQRHLTLSKARSGLAVSDTLCAQLNERT